MPEERDVNESTVRLLVEDVSRADAPARIVASVEVPARDLGRDAARLGPLDLIIDPPGAGESYNLRGLLTTGPTLQPGDLMSTRSIPVLDASEIEVPLTEIT